MLRRQICGGRLADEHCLPAGVARGGIIMRRVIPNVQGLCRWNAKGMLNFAEDAHVGLFHAEFAGDEYAAEITPQFQGFERAVQARVPVRQDG